VPVGKDWARFELSLESHAVAVKNDVDVDLLAGLEAEIDIAAAKISAAGLPGGG
jgi:hypothetical protein